MIDRKKRNTLSCVSITTYHLSCNGIQKFQCWWLETERRRPAKSNTSLVLLGGIFSGCRSGQRQQLGLHSKCYTVCDFTLHWSHLKCTEVKTAKPLLSVLRTGKPNKRGVQLFRRTNRKMTNVQLLDFFHFAPLSLDFTSHSIAIRR